MTKGETMYFRNKILWVILSVVTAILFLYFVKDKKSDSAEIFNETINKTVEGTEDIYENLNEIETDFSKRKN